MPDDIKYIVDSKFAVFRHVIRVNKYSLWGPWEIEWSVEIDDIISLPKINRVELTLNLRQVSAKRGHVKNTF